MENTILITSFVLGLILGYYAYGKGYRAQSPFYKEEK